MKRLRHFNLKLILSLLIVALPFARVFSNRLVISLVNNPTDQANQLVTFDLAWDHSWNNLGTTSANWDAAWVFVKWRSCTASANTQFTHGLISTALSDHSFNISNNTTAFQPTTADGSAVGIDPSPNNTGVMLRCANQPFGPSTVANRVTLKVTNLPVSGALDLRVYGIEMVFVPQGAYYLGDGNGTSRSTNSFASAASGSSTLQISSEAQQNIFESANLLGLTQNLSASYPKGYAAFYIMKYEITQGQYVDFLNGSTALVQTMHYTTSNTGSRYTITSSSLYSPTSNFFSCTRPYRACNFLSWSDVSTYLDWAALRPLTELEYEKACRGSYLPNSVLPTPFENAMAVTFSKKAVTISTPVNTEPGTETITVPGDANVCAGAQTFTGGDASSGPLRGGIFATATTQARSQTGASYYGVMELSGNVDEYYVSSISGVNGGVSSSGIVQGDGILDDATGQFNQFGWPVPQFPGNMIIHRGGNWNIANLTGTTTAGNLNVSDRQGGTAITRISTSGGRGGRSITPNTPTATNPTTFTYAGYFQYFVVPAGVTSLTIAANGAGGGGAGTQGPGLGAYVQGTCAVTPGEVLKVLVGGTGGTNGGGGGGTFVVRQPYNTLASCLVVAGGGGGQSSVGVSSSTTRNGAIANITTTGSGTQGGYSVNCTGTGAAVNGAGGESGTGCGGTNSGGGGGLTGNGVTGGATGGLAFTNGGTGGSTGINGGGFGGGGAAGGTTAAGGGGGYSGGGGGYSGTTSSYYGGGGGSINRGLGTQVNYGGATTNITANPLTGLSYYNTPINTNGQVQFSW